MALLVMCLVLALPLVRLALVLLVRLALPASLTSYYHQYFT